MSVVGVVALSILAGLFIAVLMALAAAQIVLFFRAKNTLLAFQESFKADLLAIGKELKSQQEQVVTALNRLNGAELAQAAVTIASSVKQNALSARRIENAALAIGQLIIPAEVKEATGLAPEEYAQPEPGESYHARSRTAALDEADERDEGRSVTEGL